MGLGFRVRWGVVAAVVAAVWIVGAGAQAVTLTEPNAPLLPESFAEWTTAATGTTPGFSLANANKDALEECGPQRSAVAEYARGGRTLHVEAIQFGDRTGAVSAFTLIERPGMRVGKAVGAIDAVGEGVVLFEVGSTLVMANGATEQDMASLKVLAERLPKVNGTKGVAPLLPTLVPAEGLVAGSLRYALGPATYAAEGGVLPAQSLGWDKSAEAVTALYADKRGRETLTVLLYPTPMIAGKFSKQIGDALPQMGPKFATAKVRREGLIVALASGSFSADEAQKLVSTVHLRQDVAMDRQMLPTFQAEATKTYSLLESITIFSGVGAMAAILLGLFLGFGRAAFRVMRGKPAAVELEFLSLHLSPQNKPPEFTKPEPGEPV
jgi:hypothetical protein